MTPTSANSSGLTRMEQEVQKLQLLATTKSQKFNINISSEGWNDIECCGYNDYSRTKSSELGSTNQMLPSSARGVDYIRSNGRNIPHPSHGDNSIGRKVSNEPSRCGECGSKRQGRSSNKEHGPARNDCDGSNEYLPPAPKNMRNIIREEPRGEESPSLPKPSQPISSITHNIATNFPPSVPSFPAITKDSINDFISDNFPLMTSTVKGRRTVFGGEPDDPGLKSNGDVADTKNCLGPKTDATLAVSIVNKTVHADDSFSDLSSNFTNVGDRGFSPDSEEVSRQGDGVEGGYDRIPVGAAASGLPIANVKAPIAPVTATKNTLQVQKVTNKEDKSVDQSNERVERKMESKEVRSKKKNTKEFGQMYPSGSFVTNSVAVQTGNSVIFSPKDEDLFSKELKSSMDVQKFDQEEIKYKNNNTKFIASGPKLIKSSTKNSECIHRNDVNDECPSDHFDGKGYKSLSNNNNTEPSEKLFSQNLANASNISSVPIQQKHNDSEEKISYQENRPFTKHSNENSKPWKDDYDSHDKLTHGSYLKTESSNRKPQPVCDAFRIRSSRSLKDQKFGVPKSKLILESDLSSFEKTPAQRTKEFAPKKDQRRKLVSPSESSEDSSSLLFTPRGTRVSQARQKYANRRTASNKENEPEKVFDDVIFVEHGAGAQETISLQVILNNL